MADLVTLDEAKRHLRIVAVVAGAGSPALSPPSPPDDEDLDLAMKITQASAIVLDYLARPLPIDWNTTIAAWDDVSVPPVVKAAVLLQLGDLYRFRGDDEAQQMPAREHGFLAPGVVALLHRYRDPALA